MPALRPLDAMPLAAAMRGTVPPLGTRHPCRADGPSPRDPLLHALPGAALGIGAAMGGASQHPHGRVDARHSTPHDRKLCPCGSSVMPSGQLC